jgi:hypothetical protein
MYPYVLGLHNIVRWIVLIAGAWSVFLVWRGWLQRRQWTDAEARATRAFLGALDLQFLLGLLLFAVFSPITRQGFHDLGAAMSDPPLRYFLLEHPVIMLVAVASAHIGAVQVRRAAADAERFQRASILYGLSLAAVAGFIPWARPLIPSF